MEPRTGNNSFVGLKQALAPPNIPEFTHDTGIIIVFATPGSNHKNTFCESLNIGAFRPVSQLVGGTDASHLDFSEPFYLNQPVEYTQPSADGGKPRSRHISCLQLLSLLEFSAEEAAGDIDIFASLCALFAALNMRYQPFLGVIYLGDSNTARIGAAAGNLIDKLAQHILGLGRSRFVFVSMSSYNNQSFGDQKALAGNEIKLAEWVVNTFSEEQSTTPPSPSGPAHFSRLTDEPNSAANILLEFLKETGAPPSAPLLQTQLPVKAKLSETAIGSDFDEQLEEALSDLVDEIQENAIVTLVPEYLNDAFKQYAAYLELHPYSKADMIQGWSALSQSITGVLQEKAFILVFGNGNTFEKNLSGKSEEHFSIIQAEENTFFLLLPAFSNSIDDALVLMHAIRCLAFLNTLNLLVTGMVYFWPDNKKDVDNLVSCNLCLLAKICGKDCLQYLVLVKDFWADNNQSENSLVALVQGAQTLEKNGKALEELASEIVDHFDSQVEYGFNLAPKLAVCQELMLNDVPLSETSSGLEIQSFLTAKLDNLHDLHSSGRHSILNGQPNAKSILSLWRSQLDILFLQWGLIRFSGANHIYQRVSEEMEKDAEIDKAITRLEAIISLQSDLYPGKAHKVAHLGSLYNAHWELYGDSQDLSHAIKKYDAAISIIDENDPKKAAYVQALGSHLEKRFQLFGAKDDLLLAIQKCQDAVDLHYQSDNSSESNLQKSFAQHALGNILKQKFEAYFDDVNDIDQAISSFQNAEQLLPYGHQAKAIIFSDLCHSHVLRSKYHSQKELKFAQAVLDLEAAMDEYNKTLPEPGPDHPGYAMILNAKCMAYAKHHKLTKVKNMPSKYPSNIQESILAGEMAVNHGAGTTQEGTYLLNLGKAYWYLHEDTEDTLAEGSLPTALIQAIECFCHAAQCETADHMVRFKAARNWAKLESKEMAINFNKENVGVLKAYEYCIILLAQIAGQNIPIHEQYRRLEKIQKIVYQATSAAIGYGYFDKAVEFFEEGRSVIWKHYFKHDILLDALKDKNPDLAKDYSKYLNQLKSNAGDAGDSTTYLKASLFGQKESQAPSSNFILSGLKRVVKAITSLADFSTFSIYKQLSLLDTATANGSIIMINLYEHQCDALVLQKRKPVTHVKLPLMTTVSAKKLQDGLKNALGGRSGISRGIRIHQAPTESQISMESVLKQLWTAVANPVTQALDQVSTPPLSHIFWCLSGPLAFLPLHAAGIYEIQQEVVRLGDFFHSSYIPNIFSLLRKSKPTKQKFQVLAVAQSITPGQSYLPKTLQEVDHIQKFSVANAKILKNEEGTLNKVKEELMRSQWAHFACHGIQDQVDGLKSGLLLHQGHRLTLKELVELKIPSAELAFLSACQSAKGDITLPEEHIHLAAGMLVAGYQGVIATMWNIEDDDGLFVAKKVYDKLLKSDEKKGSWWPMGGEARPDFRGAVHALENAVERLRNDGKADYLRWVPFVHIGL